MAFFVPKRRRVIAATLFVVTAVLLGGAWALRSTSTSTAASPPATGQASKTQVTVLGTVTQKPKDDKPGERKGQAHIGVSGDVAGLYPGASLPLRLRLTNPYSFDVIVTSVEVTPAAAAEGCGPEWIRADALSAPVALGKKGSATTDITLRMHGDAPDACKNATWALAYAGAVTKR